MVYKLLYPSKRPLQFCVTRRNKVRPRWNSPHLSRFLISTLCRSYQPLKCSERVVVNQLLPNEKNKLMHGKWCNLTRAKSIHPERDPEPTNEQRSRPGPSPTIIRLSSVGLRSSASLWLPSFLSYSSGGLPRPPPSQLSSCVTPCCTPPIHHPSPQSVNPPSPQLKVSKNALFKLFQLS